MANAMKIVNGIEFNAGTPDKVVREILYYMGTKQRIRVFYGDPKTGKDWGENYDTIGYVSKSTGPVKVPLLVNNTRSRGGSAILTGNVLRITVDKRNVYVHPRYKCNVVVKDKDVYLNGDLTWTCESHEKAEKAAAFLRGDNNVWR